jgi:pimeloyl-ACP methyl ester carboxylesterase
LQRGPQLLEGAFDGCVMATLSSPVPFEASVLPAGIRSRLVSGINGLTMHVLEAGYETPGRPCVLLLHGFPELAYSWRKVMLPLAAARFHVVAPDQRGYGCTTGWDASYEGNVGAFRILNIARDALGLVQALGYGEVAAVVGHDFGSPVAAWCALLRPDIFRSVVLMSAPFAGPPTFNRGGDLAPAPIAASSIHDDLAALSPPRKHYQWYYATPEADANMRNCPQGIHAFLRAYFHYKSADWRGNRPFALKSWSAEELAKLPTYYVMELDKGMAETVAVEMPSAQQVADCKWLPEEELAVYSAQFARTGFQGGLQWYRCQTARTFKTELEMFSGRTIDVPACFIAGRQDWGVRQVAGAFESMQTTACSRFHGAYLLEHAGHWVQQEQPQQVSALLLHFLREQIDAIRQP